MKDELTVDDLQAHRARKAAEQGKAPNGKCAPKNAPMRTMGDVLDGALEQVRKRRSGEQVAISSPWPGFDSCIGGGFFPGLHVMVAGSGVGKSTLSLEMATRTARAGSSVALVQLEMPPNEVGTRLAAHAASVPWSNAMKGNVDDAQFARMQSAATELRGLPIKLDFRAQDGWRIPRLRDVASQMRAQWPDGPLLIVFDYLQRISPGKERQELRETISQATGFAKGVADEFNAAILIISSTSRDGYGKLAARTDSKSLRLLRGRFGVRRVLSNAAQQDLIGVGKESGDIEYDADSLTVLLRPEYVPGTDPVIDDVYDKGGSLVVAAVSKVRNSTSYDTSTGWTALAWQDGGYRSLPESSVNSLAGTASKAAGRPTKDPHERIAAVVAVVERASTVGEPLRNRTKVVNAAGGSAPATRAAFDAAVAAGHIKLEGTANGGKGGWVPGKPLPVEIVTTAPDQPPESNDYEQAQLF